MAAVLPLPLYNVTANPSVSWHSPWTWACFARGFELECGGGDTEETSQGLAHSCSISGALLNPQVSKAVQEEETPQGREKPWQQRPAKTSAFLASLGAAHSHVK